MLRAPEEPLPTTATIVEEETTVKAATGLPPRVISEVPEKLAPVMAIVVPIGAAEGVKEVMIGGGKYVNNQAAPTLESSVQPPTIAIFPSALRSRLHPRLALPCAPEATNFFPCMDQVLPFRLKINEAPLKVSSRYPAMIAVLPSALIDTALPWYAFPTAS